MKWCKKTILAIGWFLPGSALLCLFSTIQKMIAGFPIRLNGYYIPFFYGGLTGFIIGLVMYRLQLIIHDYKKIVTQLESSEINFKNLFNNLIDPVIVHPLHITNLEKIIEVNHATCEKFGYSRDEFLEMTVKNIANTKDVEKDQVIQHHNTLLEKGNELFEANFYTIPKDSFFISYIFSCICVIFLC